MKDGRATTGCWGGVCTWGMVWPQMGEAWVHTSWRGRCRACQGGRLVLERLQTPRVDGGAGRRRAGQPRRGGCPAHAFGLWVLNEGFAKSCSLTPGVPFLGQGPLRPCTLIVRFHLTCMRQGCDRPMGGESLTGLAITSRMGGIWGTELFERSSANAPGVPPSHPGFF